MNFLKTFYLVSAILISCLLGGCHCSQSVNQNKNLVVLISEDGVPESLKMQVYGFLKSIRLNVEIIPWKYDSGKTEQAADAYLFDKTTRFFPAGTIFLVLHGSSAQNRLIAARSQTGKIYMGSDDGLFSQSLQREGVAEIREIQLQSTTSSMSELLHGQGQLLEGISHVLKGEALETLGAKITDVKTLSIKPASVLSNQITGEIIYIDHAGNVVTNVKADHLVNFKTDQLIRLSLQGKTYSIPIVQNQEEIPPGRLVTRLNQNKELEITIAKKSAAEFLSAKVGQQIVIKF